MFPLHRGAAMFRLRHNVLSHILSSRSASPASQIDRLISAAVSPNPTGFAVEEYLVATCGLTRPQAAKASARLFHLRSPTKPDAVLAFLAGLGLSGADIAALIAKDPQFLCAKVERTLAPVAVGLASLGLSRPEIARLVSLSGRRFRCASTVSNVHYYLRFFGSSENLLRVLKRGSCLLSSDLERVVKPNVSFLRECGLADRDIAKLSISQPWMLVASPERLRAMAACAEGIGVPRGSGMFRQALQAVAFLSAEKIAARVDFLKSVFKWSDSEVGIAVSRAPRVLITSKDFLRSRSEFLVSEVGLEPTYIAQRSVILCYSLEGRLRPRHYVMKLLKENGLLKHDRSYFAAVVVSDTDFIKKYIRPYLEVVPHLAEDYGAACKGEVPTNFRFT
ncbi:hypothetical protein ZWY2020_015377 [Hordeum vulgare]|nr:hypothetical protein ZWY2020_015377 [Hordeum vulgare]